jgi:hypothetical protein
MLPSRPTRHATPALITVRKYLRISPGSSHERRRFEFVDEQRDATTPDLKIRRCLTSKADAIVADHLGLLDAGATDVVIAQQTNLSIAQVRARRRRLGVPAPMPPNVDYWCWLTASNDELALYGVPRNQIASQRRAYVGHTKPLKACWLRAVGRWGGVLTLQEIATATGIDQAKLTQYANAHRLRYATAAHRTTHAQLAVQLWLDRSAPAERSARRFGVLLVERKLLCACLQRLLDRQAVTIDEVLVWSVDKLEEVWTGCGFELTPPENSDSAPLPTGWFEVPAAVDPVATRLMSSSTIVRAFGQVNRHLVWKVATSSGWHRADLEIAGDLGLVITRGDWIDEETGRLARWRAALPPLKTLARQRARSLMVELVGDILKMGTRYDAHNQGASYLLGITIKGREVHVPDLAHRLVHRLVNDDLSARFIRPSDSFAHQIGKSPTHALGVAKVLLNNGYRWAAKSDVKNFYPSTSIDLVVRSVAAELPGLEPGMINLVRYLYDADIMRSGFRPDVRSGTVPSWQPSLGTLLAGPGSAPLLAEIVAAQVLDRALAAEFGRHARVLRYVDDFLILAKEPRVVESALAFLQELCSKAGYMLHPEKTSPAPIDLTTQQILWLGKYLSSRGVITQLQQVTTMTQRMVDTELGTDAHRATALLLRDDLALEPLDVFQRKLMWVERLAPEHYYMLREVDRQAAMSRNALLLRVHNHAMQQGE